MKLLLRSILLLVFFFLNGYSSQAVSSKNDIESSASICMNQKNLPASILHQPVLSARDLAGQSRQLFRKTRCIKEEDDENKAKVVSLKRTKDFASGLFNSTACLHAAFNDYSLSRFYFYQASEKNPTYAFYLTPPSGKLYQLFQVFRI